VIRRGCAALALAALLAAAGCWPFSGEDETPQQRFLQALSRGQAMEANQIWRTMTPKERVEFSRGQGIKPAADPKEMQEEIIKRFLTRAEQSPGDVQVEQIAPPAGGSLLDLRRYAEPQAAPSEPAEPR
jgi:hypothetical protein